MKVLLVNKFHYKKGGSETYYFTLANKLIELGHEVVFFAMSDEKNIPCNQSNYFVNQTGVSGNVLQKIKLVLNISYSKDAYKKMSKLLDDEKPDLAILNLVHKHITCSIIDALKEHSIKIIWTMHDLITVCPAYTMLDSNGEICEKCLNGDFNNCKKNKCIRNSSFMSWLSTHEAKVIKRKNWYNMVDAFICPSEFYRKKLAKSCFTNSKIIHIPNPLDEALFNNQAYYMGDYVLYFGRLSKEKGVSFLIDAIENTKYKLVIVGIGPIENEIKKQIEEKKLQKQIICKGFKTGDELHNLIHNSKCVVLPSQWYENGPYSAMEAMANYKPLIVSDLGGLPELVENGKNGFIFEHTSKDELIEAIDKIFSFTDEEYVSMCNYSYTKAREMFDSNKYVEKLLEI